MWTLIKGFFYLVFILFLLLAAGIVYLIFFVDPNQYKTDISKSVFQTSGRTLSINGKMQWTFFPIMGLKAEDIKLSNPPSFPESDFLNIKNADISIAFLPLLKGQLQVGKIILNNLKLNLIKNTAGQTNWQFNHTPSVNSASENITPQTSDHLPFFKIAMTTIEQIDLNNSDITYEDEKQNKKISLNNIQFKSENIAYNKLFPIQTNFVLITDKIKTPINITLNTNALFNQESLRFQDLNAQTNQYLWQGWLETNFLKKDLAALNGHLVFSGKNGSFNGIDLYYYSDLADAMINKTQPTRQDTHQTPFEEIRGTLDIQNGLVNNPDLFIKAQKINASGQGTLNLISQAIDYQISLQRMTSGTEITARGPAIPILVTGTLDEPKIRPDWTKIAVTQIKSEIKTQLEKYKDRIPEQIQQGLQSLLGN